MAFLDRFPTAVIQLRLLGATALLDVNGVPMSEALRRQKAIAVLAYLAVARPRGPHRRDKIAALFWPELNADRARAALRVTLSRLREDVGEQVIATTPSDDIMIRPGELECDVVALEDALATGNASRASELYRGHFMDAIHVEGTGEMLEDWMSLERERLRKSVTAAMTTGARACLATDRQRAIELAQRAVEISPAEEEAHRILIDLHVAANDQGRALEAYEDFERNLSRAYGVPAPVDLQALAMRLRELPRPIVATVTYQAESAPSVLRRARNGVPWLLAGAALTTILLNTASFRRGAKASLEAQWAPVQYSASSGSRPTGRIEGGAVLTARGDLVVFGGLLYLTDSSRRLDELWRLRGVGGDREPFWTRLTPSGPGPSARWLFGMAADPRSDRVIVQGGALGLTSPCAADAWILENASDTAPSWREVAIRGRTIPERAGYTAAYDPDVRTFIVFGGHDCRTTFFNETWLLQFEDSTLSAGRWSRLMPDTTDGIPGRRSSYASAYDAVRHRLFVLGGSSSADPQPGLWVLEHADGVSGQPRWRPVSCAGPIPTRSGATAAFDPIRQSVFVFGGVDSAKVFSRELSRLTGLGEDMSACRWDRLSQPDPAPSARMHPALMVDPRTHDLLLFGGQSGDGGFNDMWVLKRP